MAITKKSIQFLRNETLLTSRQDAIDKFQEAPPVADGTPVVIRYTEGGVEKALLGVAHVVGDETVYSYVDLNNVDDVAALAAAKADLEGKIQTAKTELIDGASNEYDTLGKLASKIIAEATTARAAETANAAAIAVLNDADTVNGSVAKSIKDTIESLDANVESMTGDVTANVKVKVAVSEVNGKLDSVTVTTNDIASAQGLTNEVAAREQADSELDERISVFENGDGSVSAIKTELEGKITAEQTRAEGVENTLTNNITAEVAARQAIDGITGTTYAQNTNATYISGATSLNDADVKLDAALAAAKADLEGKIQDAKSELIGDAADDYNTLGKLEDKIIAEATIARAAEKANADAIEVLNGAATVDGSVKKAVVDGIAEVVANAPEDFDTLKEIADWIASDTTDSAALVARVTTTETAIATLNGDDTTTGSVAKAIKDVKDELSAEIDTLNGDAVKNVTVNGKDATVVSNKATVTINGLDIKVDDAADAKTIKAKLDELAASIGSFDAGNGLALSNGIFSVKFAANDDVNDLLMADEDGIKFVPNPVIDCGTF